MYDGQAPGAGLVTGIGRISRNRFVNTLASTYVEIVRGIPLLVQLLFIWFAAEVRGQYRHLDESVVPDDKLTVRTAYGLFYTPDIINTYRQLAFQDPYGRQTNLTVRPPDPKNPLPVFTVVVVDVVILA